MKRNEIRILLTPIIDFFQDFIKFYSICQKTALIRVFLVIFWQIFAFQNFRKKYGYQMTKKSQFSLRIYLRSPES